MRAYQLHRAEGFDSVVLGDLPSASLQPHDVRIQVRAVSLNYRDLAIARSAHARPTDAQPVIPCSDGTGEVTEVGSAVSRFRIGDRVAGIFFSTWLDGQIEAHHHGHALGGSADGMLAESVVLDEQALIAIPVHLSWEEAATLPCAGVTAYHALFEAAHIGPGQTVVVQGTGGVSMYALQLSKAAGVRAVVTSRSAEKRAKATALGADHVIDYVATPTWGEAAFAWTENRGADVVVEVGGPGTFDQSIAALRHGGTLTQIGGLTGGRGEVSTSGILLKSLRIYGIYVGSRRMFEALNRAVTINKLRPVVDKVFDFDDARSAYEYMASGAHFGKVVIRVS